MAHGYCTTKLFPHAASLKMFTFLFLHGLNTQDSSSLISFRDDPYCETARREKVRGQGQLQLSYTTGAHRDSPVCSRTPASKEAWTQILLLKCGPSLFSPCTSSSLSGLLLRLLSTVQRDSCLSYRQRVSQGLLAAETCSEYVCMWRTENRAL